MCFFLPTLTFIYIKYTFCTMEFWNQSGDKTSFPLSLEGTLLSFHLLVAAVKPWCYLAWGCITPILASVVTSFSLCLYMAFSCYHFSCSVMSNSLRPHGLQHARLPCSSPTLRACSNSCPSSWWCHPNHLILCCPLLLLPSIFSSIRVFSNRYILYWIS